MELGDHVAFLATKPLQIMTAMNLAAQRAHRRATLWIVPSFADATVIIERLSSLPLGFDEVHAVPTRRAALLLAAGSGIERLYIDRDMGLQTTYALRWIRATRPRVRFSLYEEGSALFEPEASERPSRISELLGATLTLGEGPLTDEIWTFAPAELRRRLPNKPLRPIEIGVRQFVAVHRDLLLHAFWPTFERDARAWNGSSACIYLSSWAVSPLAYVYLAESSDFTLCKLHPHIRDDVALPERVDQVLPAAIPAELVIAELAKCFDHVEVLHEGTTTLRYVQAPNVRYRLVVDACRPTPVLDARAAI